MKPLLSSWLLLGLLVFLLAACSEKSGNGQPPSDTDYTCSMHPQIHQNHPGDCPICGMALTPVLKSKTNSTHEKAMPSGADQEDTATKPTVVQLMPAQNSVGSIRTEPASRRVLARNLTLFGEIKYRSDNHLDLTSFYPGRVERVLIPYNTTEVEAGTPLLELYSEEAIADQEKYLQALRERYLTTFYERKVVSAQIETIRTRLLKAGLTDDDLKQLVQKGKVKQTIIVRNLHAGSIVGTIPHVGERMGQSEVLFHITPLERVWFAARVFEQDLSALKLDQAIEVRSKANPQKSYPGKLVFIDRVVDPATRTILARFEVDNPNRELLPEMSATGRVAVGAGEAVLVIPESALIDTGKRQLVYVKTGEAAYAQREVVVGRKGESDQEKKEPLVEIVSGIQEDETVVVAGTFLVDAEAQLRK